MLKANKTKSRRATRYLRKFSRNYQSRVDMPWLGPEPQSKLVWIFAGILIALSSVTNSYVRETQLQSWMTIGPSTQIFGSPTFSTTDAPYFLGHAKNIKLDEPSSTFNEKRTYPNNLNTKVQQSEDEALQKRPLLSVMVAKLARSEEPASLLAAGNKLLIATAAITVVAISICFGAAGYWTLGAIAGLGGGLNTSYLVRSSIGRIDTDQLNLGFLYLIFGFCLFAGRSASWRGCIAWCVAAGLVANLFMWWYGKAELIVLTAISLIWVLATFQRRASIVFVGGAIFILMSGISSFNPLGTAYLQDVFLDSNFIFPNTLATVSEVQKVSILQILNNATGSVEIGVFCLAGLLFFAVRHPIIAIAYAPLLAFSLLNFIVGNRAIFYSAPIMWFGAGFMFITTARFILFNFAEAGQFKRSETFTIVIAASLGMVFAWINSPTDYKPHPSFPKPVVEGLATLKETANPSNSVVATWWDYGYASTFVNDLPTFHDGGSHTRPTTHFIAAALLSSNQIYTVGSLKFLSNNGLQGILKAKDVVSLKKMFVSAIQDPSPDLFIVVTQQMAGWLGSISKISNWDIEKGKPIALRGNPNGALVEYEKLNCLLKGYPKKLSCIGATFDLDKGFMNGAPILTGWAHSHDGITVRSKSFNNDGDFAVQLVQIGNRVNVFLMHRQVFESSFNELFYLGQIDHPSIRLHYNNYPHIRIYKIEGAFEG